MRERCCMCSHQDHNLCGWCSWQPERPTGGCEDLSLRPLIGQNQTQSLRPDLSILFTHTHIQTHLMSAFYLHPIPHSRSMQNMENDSTVKQSRRMCDNSFITSLVRVSLPEERNDHIDQQLLRYLTFKTQSVSHCKVVPYSINWESESNLPSLTGFSGLHEVDEHVVDTSSLCHHQRLEENNETWWAFYSQW